LWIAADSDDNWWIVDEHYDTSETIDYHAGIVNSNKYSGRVIQSYGDPSGNQWFTEFRERRVFIQPANKETGQNDQGWVRLGIEKIAEKLKAIPGHTVSHIEKTVGINRPLPSLYVLKNCVNTIREFETYRWKEKSVTQAQDLNEPDVPEKANDHCMDALRYFAVSYKKYQPVDWSKLPKYVPNDPIIGI
jgi:hypothetical protein